jgi:hypothetical protein
MTYAQTRRLSHLVAFLKMAFRQATESHGQRKRMSSCTFLVWWSSRFRLAAMLTAAGCRHGKVLMRLQFWRYDDMVKSTESIAHDGSRQSCVRLDVFVESHAQSTTTTGRLHNDIPLQLTFAIPCRWPRTPATGLITTDSRAQRQNWTVGVAAQSLSGSGRTATERVKSASCPSWGNNRSAVATSAQILNNVAARLGDS